MSSIRRGVFVLLVSLVALSSFGAPPSRDESGPVGVTRAVERVVKFIKHVFVPKPLDDPMPPPPKP